MTGGDWLVETGGWWRLDWWRLVAGGDWIGGDWIGNGCLTIKGNGCLLRGEAPTAFGGQSGKSATDHSFKAF